MVCRGQGKTMGIGFQFFGGRGGGISTCLFFFGMGGTTRGGRGGAFLVCCGGEG